MSNWVRNHKCPVTGQVLTFDISDFIQNDAEHIRGTECDQKILSSKESNGIVYSPNYPLPYQSNVVCRYFIYGMQDEQNLERVKLTFDNFNVPMRDGSRHCDDGYLKVCFDFVIVVTSGYDM